jgi:hypothetical protein
MQGRRGLANRGTPSGRVPMGRAGPRRSSCPARRWSARRCGASATAYTWPGRSSSAPASPVHGVTAPGAAPGSPAVWVEPHLYGAVRFLAWTRAGHRRGARFHGLPEAPAAVRLGTPGWAARGALPPALHPAAAACGTGPGLRDLDGTGEPPVRFFFLSIRGTVAALPPVGKGKRRRSPRGQDGRLPPARQGPPRGARERSLSPERRRAPVRAAPSRPQRAGGPGCRTAVGSGRGGRRGSLRCAPRSRFVPPGVVSGASGKRRRCPSRPD